VANSIRTNPDYPPITRSNELYARARNLIPCATQTLAKGPSQHVDGVMPKYAARGKGARLTDVDGNEFLDYQMAIGPLSLGYAYPAVDDAIRRQLDSGITFSLMHPLEVEVAETLRRLLPNAEAVRFSKTGADVTSAAVRLARAFTGREKVLCCGYHGWHDWYIGVTDRNLGVPEAIRSLSFTFDYNQLDAFLEALDDDVAAVILEPMVFEAPRGDFLRELRKICTKRGIVLIFDEMWTGFRLSLGGAQTHFGVTPDLATYSKAIANGMPLSALTGRADIMRLLEDKVFFFTTFGGEALSLAAAQATIAELERENVPAYLERLGITLRDGLRAVADDLGMPYVKVTGAPCRTMLSFDGQGEGASPLEMKSFVQQELGRRGILWGGFHNLSFSHSQADVDYTLGAYREVFLELRSAAAEKVVAKKLRGPALGPVFRKTSNFNSKPAAGGKA
jgi:glutamate-1-semialdehyde 2,1-aminomutase